ncbi:unnamed protein product, partial [Timema podura]|nr:unnamed protein product [Timema podura]
CKPVNPPQCTSPLQPASDDASSQGSNSKPSPPRNLSRKEVNEIGIKTRAGRTVKASKRMDVNYCAYKTRFIVLRLLWMYIITSFPYRLNKKLCIDLCELKCRPPIDHISIEGDPTKSLTVQKSPSYADHPLVVGPRYQPCDFRCTWATYLGKDTSGVFGM